MTLSADRNTEKRDGLVFSYPMVATTHLYAGQMIGLDASGNARSATVSATTPIVVGCSEEEVNNTGGAAAKYIKVRQGCHKWANSAIGPLSKANIGSMVFCEDDVTVTSVSAAHAAAGIMVDIDADGGIWVTTTVPTSMLTGLLAANNFSELVGSKATARANIGVNKQYLYIRATDLVAADAVRYCVNAPCAGTISRISSVLCGHALVAGDATITGKINTVLITTGVITITQAASAIGDLDACAPTGAKTIAQGDLLEFLVGGANTDTAAFAEICVEITLLT